jgi:hypothetical protein
MIFAKLALKLPCVWHGMFYDGFNKEGSWGCDKTNELILHTSTDSLLFNCPSGNLGQIQGRTPRTIEKVRVYGLDSLGHGVWDFLEETVPMLSFDLYARYVIKCVLRRSRKILQNLIQGPV